MTAAARLDNGQIVLMRSLLQRGGALKAISINTWQRKSAVPLWRRGLIEIWYRQSPDNSPSFQGPYYALTIFGAKIASYFLDPAPRGTSGAQERL